MDVDARRVLNLLEYVCKVVVEELIDHGFWKRSINKGYHQNTEPMNTAVGYRLVER